MGFSKVKSFMKQLGISSVSNNIIPQPNSISPSVGQGLSSSPLTTTGSISSLTVQLPGTNYSPLLNVCGGYSLSPGAGTVSWSGGATGVGLSNNNSVNPPETPPSNEYLLIKKMIDKIFDTFSDEDKREILMVFYRKDSDQLYKLVIEENLLDELNAIKNESLLDILNYLRLKY